MSADKFTKPRPLIKMGDFAAGKKPPQNLKLEEIILGSALLEKDCLEQLFTLITIPEVFYKPEHQKVFTAIKYLFDNSYVVDVMTVADRLTKTQEFESVGGYFFLANLSDCVTTSAHLEAHARIVLEAHLKRELIGVGAEAIKNGYDAAVDVFEAIETTSARMYQVATVGIQKKVEHIADGVKAAMDLIDAQRKSTVEFTGLNTGFSALNNLTGGLQKTDLIILAARPSVGKTAALVNLCLNIVSIAQGGGSVGLFSLEVPKSQIIKRMLSCISGVLFDHINNPKKLTEFELEQLRKASKILSMLPIHIDDTASLTLSEFKTKARELKKKHDIQMIGIDYLQLMSGDKNAYGENREQEISKISRGLKGQAKDLNIPIVALSQMARAVEKENRAPVLSDLRESGGIEQDADIVMFLYRASEKEISQDPSLGGKVLWSIKKHRNGALGMFAVNANNKLQRWIGVDDINPFDKMELLKNYYVPEAVEADGFSYKTSTISSQAVDDLPF